MNISIKLIYEKITGNPCPVGQSMVPSIWQNDKTPSLSINTYKNIFYDHSTGINGNIFNMVLGKSNLTKFEYVEAKNKIESMFGLDTTYQYLSKSKVTKIEACDLFETWNFLFVWNELKQSMINNFKGNKQIIAMLYKYFGEDYKLDYELIYDMAINYNIGWCATSKCLAIPYFSEHKVTYIDLIRWIGDGYINKQFRAYPLAEHLTVHKHLNLKNNGFENALELKKFSKYRLASNFRNTRLFDSLKSKPNEPLFICEGYKDALVATRYGLSAISASGGAKSLGTFENKSLIEKLKRRCFIGIIFDNDKAGKAGAEELKFILERNGVSGVNIIDLSDVCTEKGEDLTDYFFKYKCDSKTLIQKVTGLKV